MEHESSQPSPYEEKIHFDPKNFELDPTTSERDEALLEYAEGDALLLAHEWALQSLEEDYARGWVRAYGIQGLDVEKYHTYKDDLLRRIEERRKKLGLPARPQEI